MMRGALLLFVTGVLACGSTGAPTAVNGPGDSVTPRRTGPSFEPAELEIAMLHAQGRAGVPKLLQLARRGDVRARLRAIRALGRIDDPLARSELAAMIAQTKGTLRARVVDALATSLPVLVAGETLALAKRITPLAADTNPAVRAAAMRLLGRAATVKAQPIIARGLADTAARVRVAAAYALAYFGRRKLPMARDVRFSLRKIALAPATPHRVRWAATYALANEHEPRTDDHATIFVLTRLSRHKSPTVRATALRGLSRRYQPVAYDERKPFLVSLKDRDWRVRVQAVRALAQPATNAEDHAALATWLARELVLHLVDGRRAASRLHPVAEGLRVLAPFAREAPVQTAADAVFQIARKRVRAGNKKRSLRASVSMVHCLAAALRVRGGAEFSALAQCGGARDRGWPLHLRRQLEIEVTADGFGGTVRQRFERLYSYASDRDPRIRGAALTGLSKLIELPQFARVVTRALASGLLARDVEVVGAAVEVTAKVVNTVKVGQRIRLLGAALARARRDPHMDAELLISMLDLFSKAMFGAGIDVCARSHKHSNAAVRHAARMCLTKITRRDPGPGVPRRYSPKPPVDIKSVVGHQVTWLVDTSRGRIKIALEPSVAPWHVAAVASLTTMGKYEGLLWHRVVADFVIQGGDPRGSGWGGPGYVLPAEPSATAYTTGAVGIADAGLDTGGSQVFVMHSPAPRLDNRYTRIGRVVSGQTVVDSLVVGDRILRARVIIRP